jgi:2-methylcitrate dehydratase PrpD
MSHDIEGAFAEHAARTRFADLPPQAVTKARTFLLDTLGVAAAGTSGARVADVARLAASWGEAPEATSWLDGAQLSAGSAAIVNAYLIHCLEFDCVHEGAVVHPMATILSAVLAWSEREAQRGRPVSGERLVAALCVGVDVAGLIGVATDSPVRFFRPATAGGFGAVAAIGSLAGADARTIRSAFGHMYGQTSGTLQPHLEGSPLLGLQIGFNARGAICAMDLAQAGFPGPREALSGRYGYFALMEGGSLHAERITTALGREWQIAKLAHKPFPSGRLTHGVVHGLRDLAVPAEEIVEVVAHVPPLVQRLVGRPLTPAPASNYAKLCLAFVAGVWMARGRCDVPDFLGDSLTDLVIHRHAAKVRVVLDGNPNENALAPQRIVVTLRDGSSREALLPQVYGHPDVPLSDAENLEKFRRCWGHAVPARAAAGGERLIETVAAIERLPDISALARMTAGLA